MPRSQLAINCPQGLLERLRGEAQQQRTTVTALVLAWLEAGLDGRLDAPRTASSSELEQRLDIVEQRVGALEQGQPPKAQPVPKQGPLQWDGQPLPDRRLTPAEAEGLATLPHVAEALGLGGGGSAITNWIAREARKRGGDVPLGAVYRGWRLRGKGLLPGGQKPGWLWEAV